MRDAPIARPKVVPTFVSPDDLPPASPLGTFIGVVLGGVAGLAFAGWEAAVTGRVAALPTGEVAVWVLALYAVTGGALGGAVAFGGLRSGGWAAACAIAAAGWLLSGKLGMAVEELGGPAWVGPVALLPLGLALGAVLGSRPWRQGVHLGLATTVFLALAAGLPLNLHALGAPFSGAALAIDAVVLVVAGLIGALVGVLVGNERALAPLLAVGGIVGWVAAFPVLRAESPAWPVSTAPGSPIVLIVVDTLRADAVTSFGAPRLDGITGVDFSDAAATASWTLPSTASLLTGRLPSHHGAGVNEGARNLRGGLAPDVPTVAEALVEQGWVTAGIVTNPWLVDAFGLDRGFLLWDDRVGAGAMPVGLHPWVALGENPVGWPEFRPAPRMTDAALSFVGAQEGGRWFLYVHYMDVHGPHVRGGRDLATAYAASVRYVDAEIGRLLDALPGDARVIVTADHGEEIGENRTGVAHTRHGHTLYQELLHVPLIVSGPDLPEGRFERPVSLVDVAPTILGWAEVPRLPSMDGAVLGRGTGLQLAEAIRYGPEQKSVRDGRHKWISGAGLFDLVDDPRELAPIADPAVEAALRARVPEATTSGADVPVGHELQQLLERLGYVEP